MVEEYAEELEKQQKEYIDKFVQTKRKLMQVNQLHQDNSQSKASMDW